MDSFKPFADPKTTKPCSHTSVRTGFFNTALCDDNDLGRMTTTVLAD
jgi:hypothetical protein